MARVKNPLHSGDARKDIGKMLTFKRGGVVVSYFVPRDPKSARQRAQRDLFRDLLRFLKDGGTMQLLKTILSGPNEEPLAYASNATRARAVFDLAFSTVEDPDIVLFGMLNTGNTRALYVRRFWLQTGFTGMAAATFQTLRLGLMLDVNYITGGSLITPATKRGTLLTNDVSLRSAFGGIEVNGGRGGYAFDKFIWRRNGETSPRMELDFGDMPVELRQGEMLALFLDSASVNGDRIVGGVDWSA